MPHLRLSLGSCLPSLPCLLGALTLIAAACSRPLLQPESDAAVSGTPDAGTPDAAGTTAADGSATGSDGGGTATDAPPACPLNILLCPITCPNGHTRDSKGCWTCDCAPCPDGTPVQCDLVHPPICSCPAPPATCTDAAMEKCTASNPPICECDPGRWCPERECGGPPPPAMPPMPCPDGSVRAPACVRDGNRRTCSWRLPDCPASTLEAALQGWWATGGQSGDCIEFATYLHLLPGGIAEDVLIDDNFCAPELRGTFVTPGSYLLSGSTMTLTRTDRWQQTIREQFEVAVGTIDSRRLLFHEVYRPADAVTWRGASTTETYDRNGALSSRQSMKVQLRFAAPLPLFGEGDCSVDISFDVDGHAGNFPAACRYAAAGQVQQIRVLNLDLGALPARVQARLPSLLSWLYLNPADPTYIYRGSWQRLDAPPRGF